MYLYIICMYRWEDAREIAEESKQIYIYTLLYIYSYMYTFIYIIYVYRWEDAREIAEESQGGGLGGHNVLELTREQVCMCVCIYIHTHTHIYIYIYI